MEIRHLLKLAFDAGRRYESSWTEKFHFDERFNYENWLEKNKQFFITSNKPSFYCQNIDNDYKDTICKEQCTMCLWQEKEKNNSN